MQRVRNAAVAGAFYPADPRQLIGTVDDLLAGAGGVALEHPGALEALIVPHAGYVYSGPTAAIAYAALRRRRPLPRRFLLLGPAHRLPVPGVAHADADAFETPLGVVPVDTELLARVRALPFLTRSAAAHRREHCLEVQLPFLQRAIGECSVLPLVVGEATPEQVAQLIDLAWDAGAFPVISSDLSHYLPYDDARRMDARTARQIEALAAPLDDEAACGSRAVDGLLVAARRRGLTPHVLDLRSSGDTAGDRDQVVGYGAFAFTGPEVRA